MADTSKATEARKANALARRKASEEIGKRTEAEMSIIKRYGEFLPSNAVDPVGVYKMWKKSIFAELPDGIEADDTIMYFVVSQARAAGIDPRVPNQIYAIPYKNNKTGVVKWTVIVGMQGMVTIAENTGQFGGFTKPEYEFGVKVDKENPDSFGEPDYDKIISCTVGAQKVVQGIVTTSYATVYFDEYTTDKNLWRSTNATKEVADYQDGKYVGKKMVSDGGKPKTMLAKVAKVQALRQTFSACAGLYIAEEVAATNHEDAINGEIVVPDVKLRIEAAGTREELQEILSELTIEDKKRVAPLISERLKELK